MSLKPARSCYAYLRFCSLYRSTVGFDRMFSMLDQLGGTEGPVPGYPPTISSGTARTPFASRSQSPASPMPILSIEAKENTLTIRGEKQTDDEEPSGEVLYKGIAERTFERSFQLADHVVVKGASLANGLLHVDLVRELPEAMKPRTIPIASSARVLNLEPTKVAA